MIEMLGKELMEFKPQTKPKLEMVELDLVELMELEVVNPRPLPQTKLEDFLRFETSVELVELEVVNPQPKTKPKVMELDLAELVALEVINPQPIPQTKPKVMESVELKLLKTQELLALTYLTFRPQRFVISIHHLESTRLQAPPTLMQVVFHRNRNHQKYNGINIYFFNLNNFKIPVFLKYKQNFL